jgi:GR25 family glycosyltransferase involved in LPS biosynthesis
MLAYSIVIDGNPVSEQGYQALVASSSKVANSFDIARFNAITPTNVDEMMDSLNISWNYPWEGSVLDFATGLLKSAYPTKNKKARIACAVSHLLLWIKSIELNQPILILEHDALFTNKIDFVVDDLHNAIKAIGINNPLGATRRSKVYHDAIVNNGERFQVAPYVDDNRQVPQGLAGNSAYIIRPSGASQLYSAVKHYGLWPNDALMCKQLISGLAVTKKFYTTTQQLKSTTTL